jgi:hypothetical protein
MGNFGPVTCAQHQILIGMWYLFCEMQLKTKISAGHYRPHTLSVPQ